MRATRSHSRVPRLARRSPPRALDLVAIGFTKPARFYGNTISTKEDLLRAAVAFKKRYIEGGARDA